MRVKVSFYSYFRDLADCADTELVLNEPSTLDDLLTDITNRFPKLGPMRKSMLTAVGVDYQDRSYELKDGDDVSLFPPVQGG